MRNVIEIIKKINSLISPSFLVGGAVRDAILGKEPKDFDFVTLAPVYKIEECGAKKVDPSSAFPVWKITIDGVDFDIALPRTEKKSGKGYKGFEVSVGCSVEEDLARRDFTMNAIAMGPDGNFIDPFDGVRDTKAGVLRHVSPAFAEDPLRIFRLYRFAARGYSVAPETVEFIKSKDWAEDLAALPVERVWMEVEKAAKSTYPSRFWSTMAEVGVGVEFFPMFPDVRDVEIDPVIGIPSVTLDAIRAPKRLVIASQFVEAIRSRDIEKIIGLAPKIAPELVERVEAMTKKNVARIITAATAAARDLGIDPDSFADKKLISGVVSEKRKAEIEKII